MVTSLKRIVTHYPAITSLYSIGKNKEGNDLWVLEIGVQYGEQDRFIPGVRLLAGLSGYEAVNTEILMQLAEYLVMHYGKDTVVTDLIEKTKIYIAPLLNSDDSEVDESFACGLEKNPKLLDLNKNFAESQKTAAPETKFIKKWILMKPAVISAALFSGAEVVAYPPQDSQSGLNISKEEENIFIQLSKIYSRNHPEMHKGSFNCSSHNYNFSDGITKASLLHEHKGSYLEFSYKMAHSYDIAVYTSCCSNLKPENMAKVWSEHKLSLQNFITQAHRGITGFVVSTSSKPIHNARISVQGFTRCFASDSNGFYHVLLYPGEYSIMVSSDGFQPLEKIIHVYYGEATIVDFRLKEDGRIAGVSRHSFFLIFGAVIVFVCTATICIYIVVTYKRRRGYAFHKLDQGQCLYEEDEISEKLKFSPEKGLLRDPEYHDDTSSEDELYNTYAWKNGRRK